MKEDLKWIEGIVKKCGALLSSSRYKDPRITYLKHYIIAKIDKSYESVREWSGVELT